LSRLIRPHSLKPSQLLRLGQKLCWSQIRGQNWGQARFYSMPFKAYWTEASWFYILVSVHNATDPIIVQKRCNLRRRFFCALWRFISPLFSILQAIIFYSLSLCISYYQSVYLNELLTLNSFLFASLYTLALNLLPSNGHAATLRQASSLICGYE
jgi:hypothetical protein